jgi:hypothetical protein
MNPKETIEAAKFALESLEGGVLNKQDEHHPEWTSAALDEIKIISELLTLATEQEKRIEEGSKLWLWENSVGDKSLHEKLEDAQECQFNADGTVQRVRVLDEPEGA